jgi:uncharacterized protein
VPIAPETTPLTAQYWAAARRGQVLLQRCDHCGQCWHPPQPTCPECRRCAWSWFAASGRGRLHSFTVVHHPAHPAVQEKIPYTVAVVGLAEGPLVVMNLLDVAPGAAQVGMPVALRLGPTPGGEQLVQAYPGVDT